MDLVGLLGALFCFALSGILVLLSAWFRWGSSRAARWWVRRTPVERASFATSAPEGVALGVIPYLGQLIAAVGVVALLHVHPAVREVVHTPAMWTVVIGETVLGIVAMVLVSNRRLLPILLYPAWLRPQRRAEREYLNSL